MPTYLYKREDGTTFEIEQRITEPALKVCPTTNQPVTRLISGGTGLVFKGSGFYVTDYARAGKKGDGSGKKDASKAVETSSTSADTPVGSSASGSDSSAKKTSGDSGDKK